MGIPTVSIQHCKDYHSGGKGYERMAGMLRPKAKLFGGPAGIRTLDLFHAMEARSQLRHRPTLFA